MNILIENHDTLEYLTPAGLWTKNPLNGKSYPATRIAFRAAKQEAIGNPGDEPIHQPGPRTRRRTG